MKHFLRAFFALLLTVATSHAVPVSLRVTDADNQPIAGAQVNYFDYGDVSAPDSLAAVPAEARRVAQTATDGTLALDLRGQNRGNRTVDGGAVVLAEPRLCEARVSAPGAAFRNVRLLPGENLIALDAPARVQGFVRDDAGAPLVGATVTLLGVEKDEDYRADDRWLASRLGLLAFTTRDDGRWQLENLPPGYAYFEVRAPDREAYYQQVWIRRGDNFAPPVALAPAGTIIGRVLDRDGKPLAGVAVNASDTGSSQSNNSPTDAAGNFRVTGVSLGENTLEFASANPDWMGVDGEISATIPGKGAVVDVGEVKTGAGLLISGTIRDRNGAALPGLELRADNVTLRTDANGRFEARVAKPFYLLEIARDYRVIADTPNVPDDAERFDMGEIIVERAIHLPLDVRDENGVAITQATLRFQATDRTNTTGQTMFVPLQRTSTIDGDGIFVPSIPSATYKIEGAGLWGVVEPQSAMVTVPALGEQPAPLKVIVRAFARTRASGRVVDAAGLPIENARVQIRSKQGYTSVSAYSDADGKWNAQFANFAGEPAFEKVEAAPLTFVRGGELRRDGESNNWRAADIVMARTDIALLGRVTDDKGAPVLGARVSWAGATGFEFAATDAQGNFEIANVPAVPQIVRASDGPRYVEAMATPGAPASLKLPVAQSLSNAEIEKLWEQPGARDVYRLGDYFDILGAPRIYQAARRADGAANPTQIGEGLSSFLEMRAKRARSPELRADAAIEGVELLRSYSMQNIGGEGAASLAVVAAHTDDAELREWAANWYDSRKPRLPEVLSEDNFRDSGLINIELRMADVGHALGRADADKYLADALTLIENFKGGEKRFYLDGWGEKLWGGDQKRFDRAIMGWTPTEQMAAIAGALKRVDNADEARQLLAQLEKLADDPAVLAAEAEEKKTNASSWSNRQSWLYRGRIEFARLVAKTDAPSALDVVEKLGNSPDVLFVGAAIARDAMADGQDELARRALRLGLLTGWSEDKGAPALAMLARPFDEELARQLLDKSRAKALSEYRGFDFDGPNKGWREVAFYAFALRDFDAGLGRLLLEDQWAKRLEAATAPDAQPADNEAKWARISLAREQSRLARTMASYDVPRALQWLDAIKFESDQSNNDLEYTRLAIIATALAPPAQRPFLLDAYLN